MSLSSGRTRSSTGPAAAPVAALRSPSSSSSNDQDDPFTPPPEGAPDRPWRPRTPPGAGTDAQGQGQGSGAGEGSDGSGGQGDDGRGGGDGSGGSDPWGSRLSGSRGSGGPGWGARQGPGGQGGGSGGPNAKFDITDPVQRRARYALLAGMWAFFFSLFSVPQIALLLGALALYWGITSLRGEPRAADAGSGSRPAADRVGTGAQGASGVRPQRASAVSGIVAGSVALAMVFGLFITQMVYRDYFDCVSDALTSAARESCDEKMPEWLRPWAGSQG